MWFTKKEIVYCWLTSSSDFNCLPFTAATSWKATANSGLISLSGVSPTRMYTGTYPSRVGKIWYGYASKMKIQHTTYLAGATKSNNTSIHCCHSHESNLQDFFHAKQCSPQRSTLSSRLNWLNAFLAHSIANCSCLHIHSSVILSLDRMASDPSITFSRSIYAVFPRFLDTKLYGKIFYDLAMVMINIL